MEYYYYYYLKSVSSSNKTPKNQYEVPIVKEKPTYAYPSLAFSVIVDRNHCSNLFSGWLQRAHFFSPLSLALCLSSVPSD